MRKNITIITLLIMALAISACGNKKEESTPKDVVKDQMAQVPEKVDDPAEENLTVSDEVSNDWGYAIAKIRETWRTTDIDVASGERTVGISKLAFVFCDEFKDYPANTALYEYLVQPQNYNEEKTGFHVNLEERNGYVYSHSMSQFDLNTDCCFWNRKNGHKLFAAWLSEDHEGWKDSEKLVLFYDYDPETDSLSPEPQLTDLVEKNTASFASYSVVLPSKGKDIEVRTFTENDYDSYDTTSFKMVWDGQSFTIKK